MNDPQPISPAAFDDHDHIMIDAPCRRCGYNLRGLKETGHCPECNAPIGLSTKGDLLRFADPAWLYRLARGCNMILWGIIAAMILGGIGGCLGSVFGQPQLILLISLIGVAIGYFGVWLLTSPDPSGIGDERYHQTRRIVRITLLLGIATNFFFSLVTVLGGLPPNLEIPLAAIMTLAGLAGVVGEVCKFLYLEKLAQRIPEPRYADRARLIAWGLGCSLPFVIIGTTLTTLSFSKLAGGAGAFTIPANPAAMSTMFTKGPKPLLMTGGCLTAIGGSVNTVFYVLSLILITRLRRTFREQARLAHRTWARHLSDQSIEKIPTALQSIQEVGNVASSREDTQAHE